MVWVLINAASEDKCKARTFLDSSTSCTWRQRTKKRLWQIKHDKGKPMSHVTMTFSKTRLMRLCDQWPRCKQSTRNIMTPYASRFWQKKRKNIYSLTCGTDRWHQITNKTKQINVVRASRAKRTIAFRFNWSRCCYGNNCCGCAKHLEQARGLYTWRR